MRGEPTRGSIVVVRRPDGSEHLKRIAALPGERFAVRGKEIQLSSDEFAVTGDNPAASTDSRHYGPVRRGEIVAIARFCYWPPRAWRSLSR